MSIDFLKTELREAEFIEGSRDDRNPLDVFNKIPAGSARKIKG